MHVRYGNLGHDHTTTTKAASVRKQLGTKNSKSNVCMYVCMYVDRRRMVELREERGVQRSLTRETGEEQTTVVRTRRKDGG